MKNKLPILTILIIVQLFSLKAWTACRNFFDYYHFSLFDLELQINYAVSRDHGMEASIGRLFHNKILQFLIDVYKRYTHFFDIQLLATLISFVGVVGIVFAIWYFLTTKKKDKKVFALIVVSFGVPLIDVLFNLKISFLLKLILIALPLNILAVFGHMRYLDSKNKKVTILFYFLLIFISVLWFFLLPDQAQRYCEIPLNKSV